MSDLVDGSVVRGLGGLLVCFFVIMLFVSRSLGTALAMVFCLALTPMILFGLVGLVGIPLDIISAPAANVALPLGIDEMIHLGYAVRRNRDGKSNGWKKALSQLWIPILYSALIVGCGFALLLFSTFPPTRHLGVMVSLGAILTDLAVLVVLGTALQLWTPDGPSSGFLRRALLRSTKGRPQGTGGTNHRPGRASDTPVVTPQSGAPFVRTDGSGWLP
jgi:predicted RND superfamily exporter protein